MILQHCFLNLTHISDDIPIGFS